MLYWVVSRLLAQLFLYGSITLTTGRLTHATVQGYSLFSVIGQEPHESSRSRESPLFSPMTEPLYPTSHYSSLLLDDETSTCITVTAEPESSRPARWSTRLSPSSSSGVWSARQLYDVFSVTLQTMSNFTGKLGVTVLDPRARLHNALEV